MKTRFVPAMCDVVKPSVVACDVVVEVVWIVKRRKMGMGDGVTGLVAVWLRRLASSSKKAHCMISVEVWSCFS